MLRRALPFLILCLFATPLLQAQPSLDFKSIQVNWPEIKLSFRADCDSLFRNDVDSQQVEIRENGRLISTWTLSCPPYSDCCVSTSLVLDRSGSMQGEPLTKLKDGVTAYIRSLNSNGTPCDETSLVTFGQKVTEDIPYLTTDSTLLIQGVSQMFASGHTPLWDAVFTGMRQIEWSTNACKAVIVVTDGGDDFSQMVDYDFIKNYSVMTGIRVYTIGFMIYPGSSEEDTLRSLANATNGRYYHSPIGVDLDSLLRVVKSDIKKAILFCDIDYLSDCPDGREREVQILLRDFCGGTVAQTSRYRPPYDSTAFKTINVALPDDLALSNTTISVPIALTQNNVSEYLDSTSFFIRYDTARLNFRGIETPVGSIGNSAAVTASLTSGGIVVAIRGTISLHGPALFAELVFQTLEQQDTTYCEVAIDSAVFSPECYIWKFTAGQIGILPQKDPMINPNGQVNLCAGKTITLTATKGFSSYRWSTGDTTQIIDVAKAGIYSVEAKNALGEVRFSQPVTVVSRPTPIVTISPSQSQVVCEGTEIRLTASPGFARYKWSTGAETQEIIPTYSGIYSCIAIDQYGCEGITQPVSITIIKWPATGISGSTMFCDDNVHDYTLPLKPLWRYQWSIIGGVLLGDRDANRIQVRWFGDSALHTLTAEIFDSTVGCTARYSLKATRSGGRKPKIIPRGYVALCAGDTILLDAGEGYLYYEWQGMPGDRYFAVCTAGSYAVKTRAFDGCEFISDSVKVSIDPPPMPAINGESQVCRNSVIRYSVPEFLGHTYLWVVNNGTILSRVDSSSIQVRWGSFASGTVKLIEVVSTCVGSDSITVAISNSIMPIVFPAGPIHLCQGESATLDAGAGYSSYSWSNGAKTRTINVTQSGSYSVYVVDSGGCSGSSALVEIIVYALPSTPVITRNGDLLTTPRAAAYQWNLDGIPIPSANDQFYQIAGIGSYTVTITDSNGCAATSLPFVVLSAKDAPAMTEYFDVYPNPFDGQLEIAGSLASPGNVTVIIQDILGKERHRTDARAASGSYRQSFDMRSLPVGLYMIRILTPTGGYVKRAMKK